MTKCKVCRAEFQKRSMTHKVCSPECAEALSKIEREKKRLRAERDQRKDTKQRLEALKTISDYAAETQTVFNKWIRMRDWQAGHGCISCGTRKNVQYAAGHFRSRGASSALRFNEDNVFLQCNKKCNKELSGNSNEMRKGIIKRIGIERFEAVDNHNEVKHWTRDELLTIKSDYAARIKALEAQIE